MNRLRSIRRFFPRDVRSATSVTVLGGEARFATNDEPEQPNDRVFPRSWPFMSHDPRFTNTPKEQQT